MLFLLPEPVTGAAWLRRPGGWGEDISPLESGMLAPETREPVMLRAMTLLLLTVATSGAVLAADMPPRHSRSGPAYKVAPEPQRDPDVLFTPALPTIPPLIRTPILQGSAALPGIYGTTHSYDYQGPYYGGPYVDYRDRLPYACGVYGYC